VPNVVIAGEKFGFPYGSGASSRVHAYAKGLLANGARVIVLCVEASGSRAEPLNTAAAGTYDGVDFAYTYGRTTRPTRRWYRVWLKATKWVRFWLAVEASAARGGGLDAIIVYSRSLSWMAICKLACRRHGALFIHEDCELPFAWNADEPRMRVRRWLYEHVAFRWFDGCLAISSCLEEYCRRHLRPGDRVLSVPILVDVAAFQAAAGTPPVGDAIVYCGYSTHVEVFALVEAFADIADDSPELSLKVIGGTLRPHLLPRLQAHAVRLGVADRLELVGEVRRDELPRILAAARLLALPRPDAAFSRAGLPTKLGEYLATGRPVVVNAVGDIPRYLHDGVDAYLVQPGEAPAFAERLRHVVGHEAEARKVGGAGREIAKSLFDPAVHGRRIIGFIAELRAAHPNPASRAGVGGRAVP
jgi:glycosyltransferase involved in cell wall biosynthesis